MFLSARLRRLTLCRLIGSQWRRDHRQPDRGLAPPENVAFEGRHGLFGWPKAVDSPIGWRASSACRVTVGLEALSRPSTAVQFSRERARRAGPSATRRRCDSPVPRAGTRAGRRVIFDGEPDAMDAGQAHGPRPVPCAPVPCGYRLCRAPSLRGTRGGTAHVAHVAHVAHELRRTPVQQRSVQQGPFSRPPTRTVVRSGGRSSTALFHRVVQPRITVLPPTRIAESVRPWDRSGRRSLLLLKASRAAPPLI